MFRCNLNNEEIFFKNLFQIKKNNAKYKKKYYWAIFGLLRRISDNNMSF